MVGTGATLTGAAVVVVVVVLAVWVVLDPQACARIVTRASPPTTSSTRCFELCGR
jgi:hypothetical protein